MLEVSKPFRKHFKSSALDLAFFLSLIEHLGEHSLACWDNTISSTPCISWAASAGKQWISLSSCSLSAPDLLQKSMIQARDSINPVPATDIENPSVSWGCCSQLCLLARAHGAVKHWLEPKCQSLASPDGREKRIPACLQCSQLSLSFGWSPSWLCWRGRVMVTEQHRWFVPPQRQLLCSVTTGPRLVAISLMQHFCTWAGHWAGPSGAASALKIPKGHAAAHSEGSSCQVLHTIIAGSDPYSQGKSGLITEAVRAVRL